jgi:hypothetical protein
MLRLREGLRPNGLQPFPFFTTSQGAGAVFIADKGKAFTVPRMWGLVSLTVRPGISA